MGEAGVARERGTSLDVEQVLATALVAVHVARAGAGPEAYVLPGDMRHVHLPILAGRLPLLLLCCGVASAMGLGIPATHTPYEIMTHHA